MAIDAGGVRKSLARSDRWPWSIWSPRAKVETIGLRIYD
jgi:hypothetical protein